MRVAQRIRELLRYLVIRDIFLIMKRYATRIRELLRQLVIVVAQRIRELLSYLVIREIFLIKKLVNQLLYKYLECMLSNYIFVYTLISIKNFKIVSPATLYSFPVYTDLIILIEIKKSKYNFKKQEKRQLKSLALKYIFSFSQSIWKYRKTAF